MLFLTVNLILQLIVSMCVGSRNLSVKSVLTKQSSSDRHVRKAMTLSGKLLEGMGDLTNIWPDLLYNCSQGKSVQCAADQHNIVVGFLHPQK